MRKRRGHHHCVAMPNITEGTNFTGAVAGYVDDGARIKRNVFVSSTLAGLDRISRTGVISVL